MPKVLKVILIVFGILVVTGGACVAGVVLYFKSKAPALKEMGDRAKQTGTEFGTGKDGRACLVEALRQGDGCGGFDIPCEVTAGIFLEGCLETAATEPDLCKDVPPNTEILSSVQFRLATCAALGRQADQRCGRIVDHLQQHCHAKDPR